MQTTEWITGIYQAVKALDAGAESIECGGQEYTDPGHIREVVLMSPRYAKIREGWHEEGYDGEIEYKILLSTVGADVRIVGYLDEHRKPASAKIQQQDHSTWTDVKIDAGQQEAIDWFVSQFYCGDN